MYSWMVQCVYDQIRIWTLPYSYGNLGPTSGQCEAGIMPVSHCQETVSRWTHEYAIFKFVRKCSNSYEDNLVNRQFTCGASTMHTEGFHEGHMKVIGCLKMYSQMARWFYDQIRIWTFPYSYGNLGPTSGQCEAGINDVLLCLLPKCYISS